MKTSLRSLILLLAVIVTPSVSQACPLCMGAQDSPTAAAVNNAIFIMFGVLGVIFSGIVAVAFRFYRRMKRLEADSSPETGLAPGFSESVQIHQQLKEAEQNA